MHSSVPRRHSSRRLPRFSGGFSILRQLFPSLQMKHCFMTACPRFAPSELLAGAL